jgi:glucose/arabinose dehydrogenase
MSAWTRRVTPVVLLGLVACQNRAKAPSDAPPPSIPAADPMARAADAAPGAAPGGDPAAPAGATGQVPRAPDPTAVPAALAAKVELQVVARKLKRPVLLIAAPGDTSGRLFIVEQVGRIRVLRGGAVVEKPFLDIASDVSRDNEQGLLGLAFHPDFATNGRFFINTTGLDDATRIVEYRVSKTDPDVADPATRRELLVVDQPYANHNGGHVVVGPDGWLWIGLGDGGAANDPHGNGQNDAAVLGKMLRLDPDGGDGARPVIHMKGLRNPWRYAFDRRTGDLYIGDVGQNQWEEVHVVTAADARAGGQNFGWNIMEGFHCFRPRSGCNQTGLVLPVAEYGHADGTGCCITGGEVYRGKAIPELDGVYFYADYCTGLVRSFRYAGGTVTDHWDWKSFGAKLASISSFGVDDAGELYVISLDGVIYKLVRKP